MREVRVKGRKVFSRHLQSHCKGNHMAEANAIGGSSSQKIPNHEAALFAVGARVGASVCELLRCAALSAVKVVPTESVEDGLGITVVDASVDGAEAGEVTQ